MARSFELDDEAHALAERFIVDHTCSVDYAGAIGGKISYPTLRTYEKFSR